MVSGVACGKKLRHALAFAGQIRHRCVMNREAARRVAFDLGLDVAQVMGAARLLAKLKTPPSPERLALVVMRDPGMDDEDVAEIFDRSVRWARVVREQADEIRQAEPIAEWLEYLDDGLRPGDPTPAEILAMAAELRAVRPGPVVIRLGGKHAIFSISAG